MCRSPLWLAAIGWILLTIALPGSSSGGEPPSSPGSETTTTLEGEAVVLSKLLNDRQIVADEEPASSTLVLKARSGRIYPLIRDDASRALFQDERLRNRPLVLKVREYASLPFVQVVTIQIVEEGRPRIPEYYCEICTISVRSPQICPCCQGAMELRMRPERRD